LPVEVAKIASLPVEVATTASLPVQLAVTAILPVQLANTFWENAMGNILQAYWSSSPNGTTIIFSLAHSTPTR
jgi:hypothetical protein